MIPQTVTATEESVEQKFQRLLATWHAETDHLSSTTRMISHPAYQEIIAMGRAAIPLLLREMARTKDGHLDYALERLTGANPVPRDDMGKIKRIAEVWLEWGKEHGYKW